VGAPPPPPPRPKAEWRIKPVLFQHCRRYVQAGLSPAEASRLTIALRYVELLPAVLQVFVAPKKNTRTAAALLLTHAFTRRHVVCFMSNRTHRCPPPPPPTPPLSHPPLSLLPSPATQHLCQGTSKVVVSANVSDASHPIVNAAGALQVRARCCPCPCR
jgi:hypothetical protein